MKRILLFFVLLPFLTYNQQINGIVTDVEGEELIGVLIQSSEGTRTRSGLDGRFSIDITKYPSTISFELYDFHKKEIKLDKAPDGSLEIAMESLAQELEGVVISASRRKQSIEDITVSIDIIRPEQLERKGVTNVREAVDMSPGAYTMDGQVSIRGGSGFSYGAGSRVMVVWNDAPLLSADAGDAKWESIPMENLGQIEILKGAASVLYGSGALNGIVSLRNKEPTKKGETKIGYQIGLYDQAARPGLQWTKKSLFTNQFNVYHGKMLDNFGYTVSAYLYRTDGYRKGEVHERARLNGSFIWRPAKVSRLKLGLDYSFSFENKGNFLIWESDEYGYTPSGGMDDVYGEESTLNVMDALRIMIDPHAIYFDKYNNKHSLQTRFYNTTNLSDEGYGAIGNIYFADYKFERNLPKGWNITAGLTGKWGVIKADLYGEHKDQNYSIYSQIDKSFGKLKLTAGVRGEYYQVNDLKPDSRVFLNKDSTSSIPIRPIFRAGANYQVAKATFIRASFGQAYRFPSIAERFASTSVGVLNIFPNHNLQSERGWSAEIGVKQGFKIGNFKGYADIAGFINEYRNMMEFTFGLYIPDSIPLSLNQNDAGFIGKWYGFRAENAEHARILGVELSLNGTGKIGPVEITTLLGYTFMNPIVVNPDSVYVYGTNMDGVINGGLSNPESNMLKYRFRHLAKGDLQLSYKGFALGFAARYNSFMVNIDDSFENGVNILGLLNVDVLPGLKQYREKHNKGDWVFDLRFGYDFSEKYQLSFHVNNLFNHEYSTRPGDIQPQRQFVVRFQATL